MQNYKSVEEKAREWKISSRHIQYLCRNGKIGGAVKHARVWFIPEDADSPAKNSKSGGRNGAFVGTKKKIFHSAIDLFVMEGVDNVSLRDIAGRVGIRQSTIYNHFRSKQEIIDAIYEFYIHHYLEDRLSLDTMEVILRRESLTDIIGYIRYNFKQKHLETMSDITKIIFQRIGIDERAREIAKSLMVNEGIKYVEDVFNKGIKNGRFVPFDTHAMAVFMNSIRLFTLYNWIIDPSPDNMTKLLKDEQTLYGYAMEFINPGKSG